MSNAINDLSKVVELNPAYYQAFALRARIYLSVGKCQEAVVDFSEVLRLKDSHKDALKSLPLAQACLQHVASATSAFARQQWAQVQAQVSEAMKFTGPMASHLKFMRAQARFELGEHFECIADAAEVIKLDKNHLGALHLRGRAYYKTGDLEMAKRHATLMLDGDPESELGKGLFRLVKSLTKGLGKAHKALDLVRRCFELDLVC